jgi:hypothetical protein
MIWDGLVVLMVKARNVCTVLVEYPTERNNSENLGVDGGIILKLIVGR